MFVSIHFQLNLFFVAKQVFNIRKVCGIICIIHNKLHMNNTLFTSPLNCPRPISRVNEGLVTNKNPNDVGSSGPRHVGF